MVSVIREPRKTRKTRKEKNTQAVSQCQSHLIVTQYAGSHFVSFVYFVVGLFATGARKTPARAQGFPRESADRAAVSAAPALRACPFLSSVPLRPRASAAGHNRACSPPSSTSRTLAWRSARRGSASASSRSAGASSGHWWKWRETLDVPP